MKNYNINLKTTKKLGKFILSLGVLMAFVISSFNANAQCNIKADYKFAVDDLTVKLEDNSRGDYKVLGWTFGDGNGLRNVANAKHTYKKSGSYEVCLIIYGKYDTINNKRCLDTICKRVIVKDPCDKIVAAFRSKIDENKGYFVANKVKGAKYTWYYGDGSKAGNGRYSRHQYAKPGTYEVCLQVKTRDCVKKICKKIIIKNPCDRISADFKFRVDGNVVYFGAAKYKGAKYTWSFGDGSKRGNGKLVRHKYDKPGKYKVCLQIKTKNCEKLICKEIVIKDPCDRLKADYAFTQDGNSFKFVSRSSAAAYFLWEFGDGESSRDKYVKHTYKKPGTYKVCLTVWTKDKKCKFQVCKKVVIKDPCDRLRVDFAFRNDGNTFKFESKNSEAAYFLWEFGDGESSRDEHVKHTYKKPGTYKVCLTVWTKDKKCKTQVCKKIVIKDPCDRIVAGFEFNNQNGKVTFKGNYYAGASYTWSFGDGTSRDTGKIVYHKYTKPGKYKVCLQIKVGNCTKLICKEVEIKASNTISIYPNPAYTLTKLSHNIGVKNKLTIKDAYGNLVYSDTNVAQVSKLDVSKFKVGVYIVTIIDSNNNMVMHRLIKK